MDKWEYWIAFYAFVFRITKALSTYSHIYVFSL